MPAPRKYPPELRERAIRLVREARVEDPGLSLNAAVHRIGPRVGIVADTLRGWCKQADVDAGRTAGLKTSETERLFGKFGLVDGRIDVVGVGGGYILELWSLTGPHMPKPGERFTVI